LLLEFLFLLSRKAIIEQQANIHRNQEVRENFLSGYLLPAPIF